MLDPSLAAAGVHESECLERELCIKVGSNDGTSAVRGWEVGDLWLDTPNCVRDTIFEFAGHGHMTDVECVSPAFCTWVNARDSTCSYSSVDEGNSNDDIRNPRLHRVVQILGDRASGSLVQPTTLDSPNPYAYLSGLPDSWQSQWSGDYQCYIYYDSRSRLITRSWPTADILSLASAVDHVGQSSFLCSDHLPKYWHSFWSDTDRRFYFWNDHTRVSTWFISDLYLSD